MTILAFETSAKPVSVSLLRGGRVAASEFENAGLTHSVTLMPMAERVLAAAGLTPAAVDFFAVAAGPGSFTGLRIGVGTVKGLGWAAEKPCAAVSTLLAMAYLHPGFDGVVCPVMDARRGQVYAALFDTSGGAPERLEADGALGLGELFDLLERRSRPVLFVGDGAALEMTETLDGIDFVTTIYCHDGSLCELYAEAGLRFSPEDGEAVAPAEGLSFQMAGDGLLEISVTGNGGRAAALVATVGAQDERT